MAFLPTEAAGLPAKKILMWYAPSQRGEGADGGGYVSLGVVDADATYEPPLDNRGTCPEQPVQSTHAEAAKIPDPLP